EIGVFEMGSYGLRQVLNPSELFLSERPLDVPGFNKRFSLQYVFLKPIIKKIWSESSAVISNSAGLKQLALKTSI
ncbi:MAG TPA: hypothetical protein EYP22_06160, partial [Methanosarcinales archaeon]|nr:hypothetical protein [Methanosarcinales archaeon]